MSEEEKGEREGKREKQVDESDIRERERGKERRNIQRRRIRNAEKIK